MVDLVGQPPEGARQLGNYRLLRLLGQGGFAEVYLGEHIYLNNLAAIKVLHTHLVGKDAEHFLAEAKTLVDLLHPNIVRVLDFAVQDGSPFLIMDYIAGGTLRQQHPKGSRLPLDRVILYIKQVAAALQYAHDRELIHRDVKPENMLLGKQQEVVLSDFGIATVVPRIGPQAKKDVMGTPLYMAPEQIDGRPHVSSDQYALGIVAYEWLCGETPFHGSMFHIMNQQKSRPVPPLRAKNDQISHDVEKVVLRALAKEVSQRYASVQEFANALENAYLQEVLRTVPLHSSNGSQQEKPAKRTTARFDRSVVPLQQLVRRRSVMIALGGLGLAGVVVGGVSVWNAIHIAQEALVLYFGHGRAVKTVAWAPNGKSLASGGEDNTVQIWDAAELKTLFTYRGHADHVNAVVWSPDGKQLASAAQDGTVQIWEAASGRSNFPTTDRATLAASWSHDGKYVALGYDETIQVWDASSSEVLAAFTRHEDTVLTTDWSPDGTLIASGSADGSMYLWEVATGEVRMTSARKIALQAVQWSSDGKIALGYKNGSIDIVDATFKRVISSSPGSSSSGTQEVQDLLWSPDSKHLAALDANGSVVLWDLAPGKLHVSMTFAGSIAKSVSWSPDGTQIVSGGNDGSIQIWDVATGKVAATYEKAIASGQVVAWSPDGSYMASGGSGNELRIWNLKDGHTVLTCRGPFTGIRAITWLRDGRQIAAEGDDNNAYLWDATTGSMINTYGKSGPVYATTWSPHGAYLASASQKLAWVKEVRTATITTAYLDASKPVRAISWSPDGQYIATGGENQRVRIWSAPTNANIAIYRHLSTVNGVAWSPQGKWLASCSDDKSVQIWELATQNVIFSYLEHSAAVNVLAWSPDGKYIASGSSDMTVRVWVAATGKPVFIYRGHTDKVNTVAWSPDGKRIASAGSDGAVHLWRINL